MSNITPIADYQDYINGLRSINPKHQEVIKFEKDVEEAKNYASWHYNNIDEPQWEGKEVQEWSDLDFVLWFREIRKREP